MGIVLVVFFTSVDMARGPKILKFLVVFINTRKFTRLRRRIGNRTSSKGVSAQSLHVVGSLRCIFKSKVATDRTSS